ncbi:MAG: hypothetical protein AAF960_20405, partial [Bacteroidota bacterium]
FTTKVWSSQSPQSFFRAQRGLDFLCLQLVADKAALPKFYGLYALYLFVVKIIAMNSQKISKFIHAATS